MAPLFPFQGSRPGDLASDADHAPSLPECPDTPNCLRCSRTFDHQPEELFQLAYQAIEALNPEQVMSDEDALSITAVFRIPLFGFRDDVMAVVRAMPENRAALSIRSASRVGKTDLGVNRRRVYRILKNIHSKNI